MRIPDPDPQSVILSPKNLLDLTIIIVNYNTREGTCSCIASILKHIKGLSHELIVIDNGSDDGSAATLKERFSEICVIANNTNLGFAKAVNQGVKESRGKHLMLLNSDTVVNENVFNGAVDYLLQNSAVGILGGRVVYSDGSLQLSAWKFPNIFVEFLQRVFVFRILMSIPLYQRHIESKSRVEREVDWVTGAFMFIRREVFQDIGLFDEEFFMYYEDTDFCFRAKKRNWRVVFTPHISATHYDAMSRRLVADRISIQARKSQLHYYEKNCGMPQASLLRCVVILISLLKIFIRAIAPASGPGTNKTFSLEKSIIKEMIFFGKKAG